MASAARPFSTELVTSLITSGITIAPITLHAGVSSEGAGEPPVTELFDVPLTTARLVNLTHSTGGRVIAVDTTATAPSSPPPPPPAASYDPVKSAKADKDRWTATARRDSPMEGRRAPTRTIEAPSPAIRKFTPKRVKDEDDF